MGKKKIEEAVTDTPKATSKKVESKKAATTKTESKKSEPVKKTEPVSKKSEPVKKEDKPVTPPPAQETQVAAPAKKPLTVLEQMMADIAKADGIDPDKVVLSALGSTTAGGGGLGVHQQPIQMNGPNIVKPGQEQNQISGNKARPEPKTKEEFEARVAEELKTVVTHLDKFQKAKICHKQHVDAFLVDHSKDGYVYKYLAGKNLITVDYYDHHAELPFELDTLKKK